MFSLKFYIENIKCRSRTSSFFRYDLFICLLKRYRWVWLHLLYKIIMIQFHYDRIIQIKYAVRVPSILFDIRKYRFSTPNPKLSARSNHLVHHRVHHIIHRFHLVYLHRFLVYICIFFNMYFFYLPFLKGNEINYKWESIINILKINKGRYMRHKIHTPLWYENVSVWTFELNEMFL